MIKKFDTWGQFTTALYYILEMSRLALNHLPKPFCQENIYTGASIGCSTYELHLFILLLMLFVNHLSSVLHLDMTSLSSAFIYSDFWNYFQSTYSWFCGPSSFLSFLQ